MPRTVRVSTILGCCTLATGCASDRGQYTYAPPLAPPVYSQPAGYASPPVAAMPGPAPVAAPVPIAAAPGAVPPGAVVPGTVVPATAVDPCAQGGVMTAEGMVIETPCDQSGVVMADGAVVVGASAGECCEGEIVR